MNVDEIRQTLFTASKLRMPRFTPDDTTGMKIEKLEDYLLTTATVRGDLEEARLYCQQALHDLVKRWDAIEGWEIHAPTNERARTQDAIRRAKRLMEPDLHDSIEEVRFLVARLSEQIQRLSHLGDDQVASRIYSLLVGA